MIERCGVRIGEGTYQVVGVFLALMCQLATDLSLFERCFPMSCSLLSRPGPWSERDSAIMDHNPEPSPKTCTNQIQPYVAQANMSHRHLHRVFTLIYITHWHI